MKLWERTGGYYLFWTGLVYFLVGMYNVFVEQIIQAELLQVIWLFIVSIPLWFKPLARWLNMRTIWEIK